MTINKLWGSTRDDKSAHSAKHTQSKGRTYTDSPLRLPIVVVTSKTPHTNSWHWMLQRYAVGKHKSTKEEMQRAAAGHLIPKLLQTASRAPPLLYLVEAVTKHDTQQLDELQVAIAKSHLNWR